jgi:23S rRNA (uracil1939-C5)-methyltransferase
MENKTSTKTKRSNSNNREDYCPYAKKCGGCDFQGIPYEQQLKRKQETVEKLLKKICPVEKIVGMKQPYHYRNKVHAVFDRDRKGNAIAGVYEKNSHRVVPVESCLIEDEKSDQIIQDIRGLLKSFKIKTYNEDTGYGLLRHVLIRRGFSSGQIMVVLVLGSPILPSKNNFVKALRKLHPEITTIVLNVNDKQTSMVLGEREIVLYGKGFIEDTLCGCTFRLSSKSFYQVNPVQTERLYAKAVELAGLSGKERVIDAYCGIGTIGIIASKHAGEVIGVELNPDAVRDARSNARRNQIKNISFYSRDAGDFLLEMAQRKEHADVVFLDPPRSGSTPVFIKSVATLAPNRVVYVSCSPETLARDLKEFQKYGYRTERAFPYDMFPFTEHCECICLMSKKDK